MGPQEADYMPIRIIIACSVLLGLFTPTAVTAPPSNDRLSPLHEANPYYPHRDYPALTTPRWVGEPGVEAVVVLAIDDMRDPTVYETYLRPILNRLKAIDGRAPVSIMTCRVDPKDPRLQGWLKEGLSLEVHTLSHPCPCLQKGDLAEAARTYHGCVDLMNQIPGNKPVAFRMPCCDSLNTVSPRFFAEIFNKTSPSGHFLSIDSSVFTVLTADDPALPRDLVFDSDGKERFRKYIPFASFVNTIENYPYPYIIGGTCWEFPCIVPSDWEAQYVHKPANPKTLEDLKAALDAVVLKQGVFDLVFHPYGWIKNEQVVELVDYADKKYGGKVKFLTFKEALDRLHKNVPSAHLRRSDGLSAIGDQKSSPHPIPYDAPLPPGARLLDEKQRDAGLRFVDLDEDGHLDILFSNDRDYGIYLFDPTARGWTRKVMAGNAGEPRALPKIVREGINNGFFVHSRSLWWQNEDTAELPNLVDRRSFNELLKDVEPRGKSPEASRGSIQVEPGFTVELVASEPLVKDPIAFDWGADGRLWVVEMGDYPLGADGRGKPGGVIRFLEDADGDGRYDKATTFLDGLGMPAGIIPWRDGVLVACAPEIFYAEDRDGDGRADHRVVLFTGFTEGNPQHRVNGFEFGLDGWIYGANGDSGGTVRSIKTGKTVPIRGRDFRFRPDTGEFEAESGQTQYGRHRDDWGRWFGNNNPNWGWHFVLADRDVRRNPHYAAPDPRQTLEHETRVYPVSRTLPRFNDLAMANHVTSANSPTPYRDELFGPWFANSLFVSEPVHNLVHRIVLEPEGVTFRGRRWPNGSASEFLASSDNWFRPTMLKTGPDGALWIADMYRAVIEHPEWIPDDWEKRLDLRAGSEEGRIYRVFPVDKKPRPIPRLDRLEEAGLVAALDSPGGWQRDTAQRLLLHRGGSTAIASLRSLVARTKRPQTRVQAIWALADLGGLDEASVLSGLDDTDAIVREAVVEAVEPLLRDSSRVAEAVLRLADDPEDRVRFRVALLMGRWEDHRAGEALAKLARRDGRDSWMRAAILCSAVPHVPTLLAGLPGGDHFAAPPPEFVEPLLALAGSLPGGGLEEAAARSIGRPAGQGGRYAAWQFSALAGLLAARERSKAPLSMDLDRPFAEMWEYARRLVSDDAAEEAERLAAVSLLRHSAARNAGDRDRLASLLRPRVPVALQQAAVAGLGFLNDPRIADLLLAGWKGYSPQMRGAVLDTLLYRREWSASLLSALEANRIAPGEIDPARRQRLTTRRDPALRSRAEAVFQHQAQTRKAVVETYQPALRLKGDPAAGAMVFKKLCASCHRLGKDGVEVGPDLATLNDKSPESLLSAILDPNRAFESKYAAFMVATVDGRVMNGLIASESATSVTFRRQDGKDDVLFRSDIDELTTTGQSLMPEGLEKDLRPSDLADLIAYIASYGPTRKSE
jgi:putative membrane-bound dehydrogenase-like protein